MKQYSLFLICCGSLLLGVPSMALADEAALGESLTMQQASQYLRYGGGSDRFRVELAPNYSEELGFSMKGAAGGYLSDEVALGLIVEYGGNKREYLGNAGIQFTDALSLVGTIGLLEQRNEYVKGGGRELVQQLEYGASLKGAYQVGALSGFELNGYLANADANSKSVETGQLYGAQLLADFALTNTTSLEIGGGYEWLEWDDRHGDDSQFTFSADAVQQLGDQLSLTGNVKLGASEYVYGGGLGFDLSDGGLNTNSLGLSYTYIDGRHGIEDDQRVELSWTYGFGAGPARAASVEAQAAGDIRPAADVAMVAPANNLLNDVMKRPAFLPELVIARQKDKGTQLCSAEGIMVEGLISRTPNSFDFQSDGTNLGILLTVLSGVPTLPATANVTGVTVEQLSGAYASSYGFAGPNTTSITEGALYPFTIGQKTCLLQAQRTSM